MEFREFKVLQNNPSLNTKAHNTWMMIESERTLQCDENKQTTSLIKKPSVFKKPVDQSDK
jgi:hypothetical protein